jgi:hypothetical protein
VTAYHELDTPETMRVDAARVRGTLPAGLTPPPLTYDAFPQDLPKPQIQISEAAQRLANALSLHLD